MKWFRPNWDQIVKIWFREENGIQVNYILLEKARQANVHGQIKKVKSELYITIFIVYM